MDLPEELVTERLRMRPPTHRDAVAMFTRYSQDPEVCRYMSWRPHRSIADAVAYLSRIDEEGRCVRLIFLRDTGELVGSVGGRPDANRMEFGYCVARDMWGRGIATEAARAFVAAAMENTSIWRVQAFCDVENRASARVLEKTGLTCEGILRRYMVMPNLSDAPRDMRCYAKVRSNPS